MNPNKKPPQNQEQESERETQKRPKFTESQSPTVKEGDRGPHVDRVGMPTTDVED